MQQRQPNFTTTQNAIPATDFDNMPADELQRLINEAHRLKTGRSGRVHTTPPPAPKRVVDLDQYFKRPE